MILGCDLSNNNGLVDWSLLGPSGIAFALAKCSEGTDFPDEYHDANTLNATNANLITGSYHFGRPSLNTGHDEALFFDSKLHAATKPHLLILDLEDNRVPPGADLLAYTLDWMGKVESIYGYPPILYSRVSYMADHNLIGQPRLARYGLWLADYQTARFPLPPSRWPVVALWQYGQGQLPGVRTLVDLNVFNGTADQMRKYGGG